MSEKRIYTINAEIPDCEIRAVKDVDASFIKDGKTIESHYIELMCDVGESCDRIYLKDKDMANLKKYKRGDIGVAKIRIDVEDDFKAKYKILVTDFIKKG